MAGKPTHVFTMAVDGATEPGYLVAQLHACRTVPFVIEPKPPLVAGSVSRGASEKECEPNFSRELQKSEL